MKLKIRLTIIIVLLVTSISAILSVVLVNRARALQTNEAQEHLKYLTGMNAEDIQGRLEVYYDSAVTLSEVFARFNRIGTNDRRSMFNNILYAILDNNPKFLSIYTIWKPGVLDNRDREMANTSGTDASGSFISWFCRDGEEIELRAYPNAAAVLESVSGIPTIGNPKPRTLDGETILVSDIRVPIIPNDANKIIVGIVGIEINLTYAQSLVEAIHPYETGYATLYANDGTIIFHRDKERIGEIFREASGDTLGDMGVRNIDNALETAEPTLFVSEDNAFMGYPFFVGKTVTPWILACVVPTKTVLQAVNDLTVFSGVFTAIAIVVSAILVFFIASRIAVPIVKISHTLKDISEGEGDLTKTIPVKGKDEVSALALYYNQTLEKIKNLVVVIKEQAAGLFDIGNNLSGNMTQTAAAVNQITANIQSIKTRAINQSASVTEANATMEQIALNINKLNESIEQQTVSVTESSSAIEEMLANIRSVTETLVKNAGYLQELIKSSELGRGGLREMVVDIQEIAKESEGLKEINAVMENIASQTNLLSMNAAIEAAHAGEAGRGFAVVADEIRKLAENSGEQSKTIFLVLKKIMDSIDKITRSANEMLERFESIDQGIKNSTDQENNIRHAMEEQSEGSQQILEAIGKLNEITQQVKDGSREMMEGSKEVIIEGQNLEKITQEITSGIQEMNLGADQINIAVNEVNNISNQNKEKIDVLVKEVSRFKVD
jgi:methyl-accepting chemotaxis protein